LWGGLVAPGFDRASPSQIVGQVFGGDAVEAAHPFLETTVIGVDVVDMEMGSSGLRLAGSGRDVKRDVGLASEGDDRMAAVADEEIGGGDDAIERRRDRGSVDLGQDGVEGRALAVARDEDRNIFEEEARVSGFAAPLARLSRNIGSSAFERFEDEGLVRLDDSGQLVTWRGCERRIEKQSSAASWT